MTTDAFTWERALVDGGAYRAGLADLGGADMVNEAEAPDESTDFTAGKGNEWARQLAGLNRMIGSAVVSVTFTGGGVPQVDSAVGMSSTVVPGSFSPTDNGSGDTTLTWLEGVLPVPTVKPTVSINGSTPGMHSAEYVAVSGILRSVRVRTQDASGTPQNYPFTVTIR